MMLTGKCGNCDAVQLEATRRLRLSLSALIMTPMPSLKSLNLSIAVL